MMTPYGLGRLPAADERDRNFLLAAPAVSTARRYRYWYDNGWWGNQLDKPYCVGYAWAHFIEDAPTLHWGVGARIDPVFLYNEAQKVDEWPGEGYHGTSVRAGAKVLQRLGAIGEYLWAYDIDTIERNVLEVGPVVMGTNWTMDMFTPDRNGVIHVGGQNVGGHAYVLNGVNRDAKKFRLKNSWGREWGVRGNAWISYADMALLLNADGEACMAVERAAA